MNMNEKTDREQLVVRKKFCPRKNHWVPVTDFHFRSASPDGLQCYCKNCNIERQYEPGGAAYRYK